MPVTLTDVNRGTIPGDNTGSDAFTSFGVINTNNATLEAAIADLADTETISGLWSFSNASGLLTNVIGERTAAAGVTIDGVLLKDGLTDGRDVSADGTALDTHVALTNEHIDWTAASAQFATTGDGVFGASAVHDSEILLVQKGTSGIGPADIIPAHIMVIEGSSNSRVAMAAPATGTAGFGFIHPGSSNAGTWIFDFNTDVWTWSINGTSEMTLSATTADFQNNAITTSGAITGGTLTGTLQTAAQPNITSVGTLTGFTSTGIDDNATVEKLELDNSYLSIGGTGSTTYPIIRPIATGALYLQGGNASDTGAGISLYGQTHATAPDVIAFKLDSTIRAQFRQGGSGSGYGFHLLEQAAPDTNIVGYGQIAVLNTTPASFDFRDDAGNPAELNVGPVISGTETTSAYGYMYVRGNNWPGFEAVNYGSNANSPYIKLKKNRGTEASPAGNSVNDWLGQIMWSGYNATPASADAAYIGCTATTTTGNLEGRIDFSAGTSGAMALFPGGNLEVYGPGGDVTPAWTDSVGEDRIVHIRNGVAGGCTYMATCTDGTAAYSGIVMSDSSADGEWHGGILQYAGAHATYPKLLEIGAAGDLWLRSWGGGDILVGSPLKISEVSAAATDDAGYGQLWVKNDTPNKLWFTDDAGTDFPIIEHGTFTPFIADATLSDSESQTYTNQSGHYSRIGEMVFCRIRMDITSLGTLTTSDSTRIAGLPFTSKNDSVDLGTVMIGYADGLSITAGESITGYVEPNATYIRLYTWDSASGVKSIPLTDVSATGQLWLTVIYPTS